MESRVILTRVIKTPLFLSQKVTASFLVFPFPFNEDSTRSRSPSTSRQLLTARSSGEKSRVYPPLIIRIVIHVTDTLHLVLDSGASPSRYLREFDDNSRTELSFSERQIQWSRIARYRLHFFFPAPPSSVVTRGDRLSRVSDERVLQRASHDSRFYHLADHLPAGRSSRRRVESMIASASGRECSFSPCENTAGRVIEYYRSRRKPALSIADRRSSPPARAAPCRPGKHALANARTWKDRWTSPTLGRGCVYESAAAGFDLPSVLAGPRRGRLFLIKARRRGLAAKPNETAPALTRSFPILRHVTTGNGGFSPPREETLSSTWEPSPRKRRYSQLRETRLQRPWSVSEPTNSPHVSSRRDKYHFSWRKSRDSSSFDAQRRTSPRWAFHK